MINTFKTCMIKLLPIIFVLLFPMTAFCQKAIMVRSEDSCHPGTGSDNRKDILGAAGQEFPFNGIVHIGKNKGNDWGTGAFISTDEIITARHVAKGLHNLELIQYTEGNMIDIYLSRGDFEVYYDHNYGNATDHDLAIIRITDPSKIKALANFIFKIADYNTLWAQINSPVHLSGFPFDKADKDQYRKPYPVDTLSDKSTTIDKLLFNPAKTMMGYPLYSCSGDSGAPVWVKIGPDYFIIGVHEGYKNGAVADNDYNICTLINKSEYDWILNLTH
jgi:V8-like Glu-specific endopeptidase